MFKKTKELNTEGSLFIVEISELDDHLYIAAYDVNSPNSLLIDLEGERKTGILNQFENDLELMSNSMQVMNKRLVLLNPKYNPPTEKKLMSAPNGAARPQMK